MCISFSKETENHGTLKSMPLYVKIKVGFRVFVGQVRPDRHIQVNPTLHGQAELAGLLSVCGAFICCWGKSIL